MANSIQTFAKSAMLVFAYVVPKLALLVRAISLPKRATKRSGHSIAKKIETHGRFLWDKPALT